MDVAVTFRHMEPTGALKQYVDEKVSKIARHLVEESGAEVVLSVERHHHHADIWLKSVGAMRGHETSTDMYNSIDRAVSKIERQPTDIEGNCVGLTSGNRWQPCSCTRWRRRGEHRARNPPPIGPLAFDAHPLSVDEAMMQIDLLNNVSCLRERTRVRSTSFIDLRTMTALG